MCSLNLLWLRLCVIVCLWLTSGWGTSGCLGLNFSLTLNIVFCLNSLKTLLEEAKFWNFTKTMSRLARLRASLLLCVYSLRNSFSNFFSSFTFQVLKVSKSQKEIVVSSHVIEQPNFRIPNPQYFVYLLDQTVGQDTLQFIYWNHATFYKSF